jgi:Tfp pilus assembly protein PilF
MNRIETLKQYLEKSPGDSFLNHALALEYIKLGDDSMARQYFEKNLLHAPSYVATYYHLAKLLERMEDVAAAITVYEQGMAQAKEQKDMHSYSELRSAHEDLVY